MLSITALKNASDYAAKFREAFPFKYVAINDFLDADLCERLRADFPSFDKRFALNEMGEVAGKAVRMDVRDISPAYREIDAWIQTPDFLHYISHITGIPDLLYDPDYVGGGTHENRDGQCLDAHVDFNYHPRTHWHRRLNLIIYLNPEWDADWGGCLDLHSNPWDPSHDRILAIPPQENLCVIFETNEHSWHGFEEIRLPKGRENLSRKSFAIYLYTRERPLAEVAPSHGTVYVPKGAPGWNAGRVLSEPDVRDLTRSFARMRSQIHLLYDREKNLGSQIDGCRNAIEELRKAQRLPIQGYATQAGPPRGLWPDGWASGELAVEFIPTRKVKTMKLVLMATPQMVKEQCLQIEVSGRSYIKTLMPEQATAIELPLGLNPGESVLMQIRAECTFVPAESGGSNDQRELAYRIVSVILGH